MIYLYLVLVIINIVISFITNYFVVTEEVYLNSFSGQLAMDRIQEIITFQNKWSMVVIIIMPVFMFIKIMYFSISLQIGFVFKDCIYSLRDTFKLIVIGEYIFIIPSLLKLSWIASNKGSITFENISFFAPLSLFSFFDSQTIQPILVYPLQLMNVFEILFWLFLAYCLSIGLKKKFVDMLELVAIYYGGSLVIWIVTVMFLSVSLS